MMRIKLGVLRSLIRTSLNEQAWVPGRWDPESGDPIDNDDEEDMDRFSQDLEEVDLDPSNNPGRPSDPFEFLGMRPKPTDAMAPPSLGGGYPSTSSTPEGGGESGGAAEPTEEPTE